MTQFNLSKVRLSYLDGLRGLAAIYVVLYHLMEQQGENVSMWINIPSKILRYGGFSVVIFIVLSGYCLMLPVVRSQRGYIPGSLSDYFKRRGKRILPPYYAALIFCILLSIVIVTLKKFTNFQWQEMPWDWYSPYFSHIDIILHLLLIHNLTPGREILNINAPMWSVAVEWQIYFLFPLVLLPLWRKFGLIKMLVISLIIGLIPHYLMNGFMDISCPWFLTAFALGMTAADIGFSQKQYLLKLQKSLSWSLLTTIFAGLAIITEWEGLGVEKWVSTIFAALAAACLMVYCTNCFTTGKELPKILQICESKIAIALGKFSYSLYLTHAPILTGVRHFLLSFQLPNDTFALLLYPIGLTMCLLFAYLFYLLFERPTQILVK